MLREVAAATGRRIVFFCAFGERSAMAVTAAKDAGLTNAVHIEGGIDTSEEGRRTGGRRLKGRRGNAFPALPGDTVAIVKFRKNVEFEAQTIRLDSSFSISA